MKNNYILFLEEGDITSLNKKGHITIPQEEKNHIQKVLRKNPDFEFIVSNGKGAFSRVILDSKGFIQQISGWESLPPGKIGVSLMLAPIKRARLEWSVQKTAELGVSSIYLIRSNYSNLIDPKKERLERLIKNACCQSQNLFLPEIHILNIPIIEMSYGESQFFLWGDARSNLTINDLKIPSQKIKEIIFINGPEGGWNESERNFLRQHFPCISLSKNILRAETATICALYHLKLLCLQ